MTSLIAEAMCASVDVMMNDRLDSVTVTSLVSDDSLYK